MAVLAVNAHRGARSNTVRDITIRGQSASEILDLNPSLDSDTNGAPIVTDLAHSRHTPSITGDR